MILPFTLPIITPPQFDLTFFASAAGILLIDLVLSGDNALVIGATASRLPRSQRMLAIVLGGIGAVLFRLILASVATTLLQIFAAAGDWWNHPSRHRHSPSRRCRRQPERTLPGAQSFATSRPDDLAGRRDDEPR